MKHSLSALLIAALLLGLCGCAAAPRTNDDRLQVVCSIFPPYDFVRQIAGDAVEVSLLLDPGQESHSYEPTPKDILKLQDCDLFIYGGGESEAWVADLLTSVGNGVRTLTLMECMGLAEEEHDHKGEHHDHEETAHDEHVWTAPKNAITIVQRIADELGTLSEPHADTFCAAAADYTAQLTALDEQFRAAVTASGRRTLVFADHFPFRHFAESYGLDCPAAYPGCDHSAEVSSATVAALIDRVKNESIPVVLYIEFSSQQLADTLCEATGAQKRLFHSCHNVTADELAAGATYLSLMTDNLSVLKEALA